MILRARMTFNFQDNMITTLLSIHDSKTKWFLLMVPGKTLFHKTLMSVALLEICDNCLKWFVKFCIVLDWFVYFYESHMIELFLIVNWNVWKGDWMTALLFSHFSVIFQPSFNWLEWQGFIICQQVFVYKISVLLRFCLFVSRA